MEGAKRISRAITGPVGSAAAGIGTALGLGYIISLYLIPDRQEIAFLTRWPADWPDGTDHAYKDNGCPYQRSRKQPDMPQIDMPSLYGKIYHIRRDMDREIIYILAVVNLTLGFVLVYGCKKIRTGEKKEKIKYACGSRPHERPRGQKFFCF